MLGEDGLSPTAAVVTVGDEVVEGRIQNANATWIAEELMKLAIWPRLIVAVPDDHHLIVRILRIAADSADYTFVCGGLGFTPDDITRKAVASAFHRDLAVHRDLQSSFTAETPWADTNISRYAATFPVDALPIESPIGGVPGFCLGHIYALPGAPMELQAMFATLKLETTSRPIHRTIIRAATTEDRIATILQNFTKTHPRVRLGSYPTVDSSPPLVTLVLMSRSASAVDGAADWLRDQLGVVVTSCATGR